MLVGLKNSVGISTSCFLGLFSSEAKATSLLGGPNFCFLSEEDGNQLEMRRSTLGL